MVILITGASHTGKILLAQRLLEQYRWHCLVMSENYIRTRFSDTQKYANVVERRLDDDCAPESVLEENTRYLELAQKHGVPYRLINEKYSIDINEK